MLTALMIAIVVLSTSAGEVLITHGMKQAGEISVTRPREILVTARRVLANSSFAGGILCMAVLFWADVSFVVPATSLSYVSSTLGARFLLKERVNRLRWGGTFLVCLGAALISWH